MAPGKSVSLENKKIRKYLEEKKPIVISVNYIDNEIQSDYVFMSNAKRYSKLADMVTNQEIVSKTKFILTSNITPVEFKPEYVLNYESLLASNMTPSDNSLFLILNFFKKCGVKNVQLAGFDGYIQDAYNYCRKGYELSSEKSNSEQRNKQMSEALSLFNKELKISFITPTLYSLA